MAPHLHACSRDYIVRANALEGNIGIYKYVDGRRNEIKSGSATVKAGIWQELRAEANDTTFAQGGAGLWTKADSVTCFDDVTLGPVGSR